MSNREGTAFTFSTTCGWYIVHFFLICFHRLFWYIVNSLLISVFTDCSALQDDWSQVSRRETALATKAWCCCAEGTWASILLSVGRLVWSCRLQVFTMLSSLHWYSQFCLGGCICLPDHLTTCLLGSFSCTYFFSSSPLCWKNYSFLHALNVLCTIHWSVRWNLCCVCRFWTGRTLRLRM